MGNRKTRSMDLAVQRVEILLEHALRNAGRRMDIAQRQALIARRICEKVNLRLPYYRKQVFCRRCKLLIVPGVNARVRIGGTPRAIRVTCLECGSTYRRLLSGKLKT